MVTKYTEMPIGNILRRAERFEATDDLKEYSFAGIYSFSHGVFVGEQRQGSSFKLPKVQRISEGDFVYSKIMAWEGGFGIVPKEAHNCVISNAFVVYEIDEKKVDRQYLSYYFKIPRIWKSVGAYSTGTNVRRRSLHPDQFEKTIIPLPPLEEQHRIVARIEELAAKIEEARGLRREAMEEIESLSISYLSRQFDYQISDNLPLHWRWSYLSDLLINDRDGITTGPFGTLLQKSEIQSDGIPVIGIANVQKNKFYPGFNDYISLEKAEELITYRVKANDILVARSGTVGRSCVVPQNLDSNSIMSTNLMRLRLNEEIFLPELLCKLFNGSSLIERYKDAHCYGSSRTFFTQKMLLQLQIPTPPLHKQEKIIVGLNDLQEQVKSFTSYQSETTKELDALLPSILNKAFKGEL